MFAILDQTMSKRFRPLEPMALHKFLERIIECLLGERLFDLTHGIDAFNRKDYAPGRRYRSGLYCWKPEIVKKNDIAISS